MDGIVSSCLAFDDHGVIDENVNAERMLGVAEVSSLLFMFAIISYQLASQPPRAFNPRLRVSALCLMRVIKRPCVFCWLSQIPKERDRGSR